jgi:hypothetical protein
VKEGGGEEGKFAPVRTPHCAQSPREPTHLSGPAARTDAALRRFRPATAGRFAYGFIGVIFELMCVCLLLQYLIQSCARGGRRIVEDMCYEIQRAEACVD